MIIYTDDFSNINDDYKNSLVETVSESLDIPKEDVTSDDIYEQFISDTEYFAENLESDLSYIDNKIDGKIIAIADLGLWDGRRLGYKELDTLTDLSTCCQDYNTLEIDRYKNLTLTAVHHDGTNYITFRELKTDLTDEQIYNFENKIYYGKATKKDITRYTKSIGKYFLEYYGLM